MPPVRILLFLVGLISAATLLVLGNLDPAHPLATRTAAVAIIMAAGWLTEAIPLAVTALLPLALFPLLGVEKSSDVAAMYFNDTIILFLGGFLIALAMQRWNLHKRIALWVMLSCGVRPGQLLLGVMLATALLSMWISNTATAMMMVTIVTAVTRSLEFRLEAKTARQVSVALLLGVAYSASVGGLSTLVGTPPNLAFRQIYAEQFPSAAEIGFAQWMCYAVPVSVVMLALTWILLRFQWMPSSNEDLVPKKVLLEELKSLGSMSQGERIVLLAFISLMILWPTRTPIEFGLFTVPGWSDFIPTGAFIKDGTVAITVSALLFMIPVRNENEGTAGPKQEEGPAGPKQQHTVIPVMDWETAKGIPWGIVLLFGGGFALAGAFSSSGLSAWIGNQLASLQGTHPLLLVAGICLVLTFLTELTSNLATAQMFLPILAQIAITIGVHPLLLMLPATLSCSCAFMMPVATPPNAIVMGSGHVRTTDMARTGVLLNILGVIVITALSSALIPIAFGVEANG